MLGLGLSLVSIAVRQLLGFSPATLFGTSDQGVWYDPSDFTTLFQDSAGTTPVTALEQPVGLMLDKSKGLVLGPELVTNGDFGSSASWSLSAGAEISGGVLTLTTSSVADATAAQGIATTSGKRYAVTVRKISSTTANTGAQSSAVIAVANGGGVFDLGDRPPGNYTFYPVVGFTGLTSFQLVVYNNSPTTTVFDSFSVRELPGNHATQPTATSRPVVSARVNLLTKSEQFDDAAWTKSGATVTANAITAPNGTTTADKLVETATAGGHQIQIANIATASGASHTYSIYAKQGERTFLLMQAFNGSAFVGAYFNLATGTVGTVTGATATIVADANGFYKCTLAFSAVTGGVNVYVNVANSNGGVSYTGDGTSGIYIWGADLRASNDGVGLPAYQRVNTATDYDSTGFPVYLRADGVDDGMVTNSINFTATDKMTVVAGVRKLSDAAAAMFLELSATASGTNGAFYISAPEGGATYGVRTRGTTSAVGYNHATFAAPITNVIAAALNNSGAGGLPGNCVSTRFNAVLNTTSATGITVAGNFGNDPLYLFRRGGTTLPFNGRFYGMTIVNKLLSTTELTQLETYTNSKTRAFA
jgi:hypothetical protein